MTGVDPRSAEARVRVLIVDDHAIVRKGIRALLSEAGGFEVVGEADNGQAAVLGKLHLASRTQAALYALREGLTDADAASAQEE